MASRKRRRHELPDVEDVLRGAVDADASTLFRLIARVNPTGRVPKSAERDRRYAVKSRLQSLLVREHSHEIEVLPAEGRDGLVTLRRTYLGGEACHAVIAELDDDARSWVQMQLDLAAWTEHKKR